MDFPEWLKGGNSTAKNSKIAEKNLQSSYLCDLCVLCGENPKVDSP
jgi:hypothetical protein